MSSRQLSHPLLSDMTGDPEAPALRTSSSSLSLPKRYEPFYERLGSFGHFLAGLDWFTRVWRYFDGRLSAVRYLIAVSSFYGGIQFQIGSFAGAIPKLADNASGGFDAYAWLVIVTFFVGGALIRSYFFTMGCFLLSVEAMNRNFPEERAAWKAGRRPDKPRFRFLWVDPKNLGWWGGVSYTFGALLYNVGTTSALADCFRDVTLTPIQVKYLGALMFLLGGPFFFTSGLLYVIEFSGNPLKGILPGIAERSSDLRTFTYWVNFCNFYGGALFMMSGFWGYNADKISVWEYRIQNIFGFGIGAVFFSTAGLLLFIQMSLARCQVEAMDRVASQKLRPAVGIDAAPQETSTASSSFSSQRFLLKT